jgi:hypothetical protein
LRGVGEEPAAELGERPFGFLEHGQNRLPLSDRKSNRGEVELEPAGDKRSGGPGDVAALASRVVVSRRASASGMGTP